MKTKITEKQLNKILLSLAKQGRNAKKNLAEHCKVPQSNISIWLKEKFIPAKHREKVFEYFGM